MTGPRPLPDPQPAVLLADFATGFALAASVIALGWAIGWLARRGRN